MPNNIRRIVDEPAQCTVPLSWTGRHLSTPILQYSDTPHRHGPFSGAFLLLSLLMCGTHVCCADDILAEANRLLLTGRYAEAESSFQRLATKRPIDATLGVVACRRRVGKLDDAAELLQQARRDHPVSAAISAELARLAFERGDYRRARKFVGEAIRLDGDQFLARWIDAELHRVTGRLDDANDAYRWFVRYYNRHQQDITDPEHLQLIGLAAAQFARWNRNSNQFSFLVNRLFPRVLQLNTNYWPAHLASAKLFLEKYNEADALTEVNAAQAINPNAAEVHAARARLALDRFDLKLADVSLSRAIEINPHFIEALQLRADLLTLEFRFSQAERVLEKARKLNPLDETTLGRLAAVYGAIDGLRDQSPDSRMAKLIKEVTARNEHCGDFFLAIGTTLEQLRKFPHAAIYYEEAQKRMPQLTEALGRLGLICMRLGEEGRGAELLEQSFEIDPFNVRVKNMLEVLEVLGRYAVIETEHFVLKFDRGHDDVLAEYAAKYLEEEVYPEITKKLAYQPSEKTLFEIFSRSGSTGGHGWFSARMVGLPFIGTIGACAGRMVALVSPSDMPKPYNWGRVLRHEFVHVVNLQQTDFGIPHWFTEALAVWHEGYSRPPSQDEVLVRRALAGKLFNLETINQGFLRPGGDDWSLAYCQAELYARYMTDVFGETALTKMLEAYANNLTTRDAIPRCFDVSQEQFESGYGLFLERVVEELKPTVAFSEVLRFSDLEQAVKQNPEDPHSLARLAQGYLQRGAQVRARQLAIAARNIAPKEQLAAYVLARLYLSIGDVQQAVQLLESSLDEQSPQQNALGLLAGLRFKAERFNDARRLYELGSQRFAGDKWLKALAQVYLAMNDAVQLKSVLKQLAARDVDDPTLRKELAKLALEQKDYIEANQWANQAVQIDVLDADLHVILAEALAGTGQVSRALEHCQTAIRLDADHAPAAALLEQLTRN